MKSHVCMLMLILLGTLISLNSAGGADWIFIGKSKDGNKYCFVDQDNLRENSEDVVTVSQKYSYVKPILFDQINKPVIEIVANQEWNCDEEKYNNLQLTFYFVDGTKRTETYPEALWHYVKSGTLEQDICDYVCGQ